MAKPLTNAERQARFRAKRNELAHKAVLYEAHKPWELSKAHKGDADGYIHEALDWWTAYEYRVRSELELCPTPTRMTGLRWYALLRRSRASGSLQKVRRR
jgi:hypothetical protein